MDAKNLTSNCHHIRFNHNNDYKISEEDFVKFIEEKYQIDIKSLPKSDELLHRFRENRRNFQRKINDARFRKTQIVKKLLQEFTKQPLNRTKNAASAQKKYKIDAGARQDIDNIAIQNEKLLLVVNSNDSLMQKDVDRNGNQHQNSPTSFDNSNKTTFDSPKLSSNADITFRSVPKHESKRIKKIVRKKSKPISSKNNTERDTECSVDSSLGLIDEHKLLSSFGSKSSYKRVIECLMHKEKAVVEKEKSESLILKHTRSLKCTPEKLHIAENTLEEQTVNFTLLNYSDGYKYVQFKDIINRSPFLRGDVAPNHAIKLIPGQTTKFKFIFKLAKYDESFQSQLYFKVGGPTHYLSGAVEAEAFCVAILSFFTEMSVTVPESITIPPIFSWQMGKYFNRSYPKRVFTIEVNDNNSYNLHIFKKRSGQTEEFENDSVNEKKVTEEMYEKENDDVNNSTFTKYKGRESAASNASIRTLHTEPTTGEQTNDQSIVIATLLVFEIINRALDTFLYEKSHFSIPPHSKTYISVYFTKMENYGSHYCYYEFEFYDKRTENLIIKKTAKIFADVLPHPIKIVPEFLDMTRLPAFGHVLDYFSIFNNEKCLPVTVKIILSRKMRKLMKITPPQVSIPPRTHRNFQAEFCSNDKGQVSDSNDASECLEFVLFTIKILAKFKSAQHHDMPPLYYEIIAACSTEYKKVYGITCSYY